MAPRPKHTVSVRVLIVDDHAGFRKAIRRFLESNPNVSVCGEAANGLQAIEMARELQPDVILMDITMDGLNGLDATRVIRSELPKAKVVILSQHDSPHMFAAAMKAGANAYVTKSQATLCLFPAIEAVMKGEAFGPCPGTAIEAAMSQ
jgi:DNA-binding NarL/FixJ family response regulator